MMGLTTPIVEYSHSLGEAIIGGYVYRGSAMPALQGVYVFGDTERKGVGSAGSLTWNVAAGLAAFLRKDH